MGTHPIFESDFDCLTGKRSDWLKMSFYRNVVWFAKGYQEYTKGGYLKKAKNFKSLNRDLSGKTILITGGNSGIGLDAACLLGSLGANIHIACRSKERGEAAVEKIKENSKESDQSELVLLISRKINSPKNEIKSIRTYLKN